MLSFLRNRVLSLYAVYVLLVILYLIVNLAFKQPMCWDKLVLSFFVGDTIVAAGWYIQVLLLFYVLWWIAEKFFTTRRIVFVIIGITVFNVLTLVFNFGNHWSLSNYAFVVGMLIADKKQYVDKLLERHLPHLLIAVVIILTCSYVYTKYSSHWSVRYSLQQIVSVMLPIFFYALTYRVSMKCKPLLIAGAYSLEIFTLQGIVFILLRNAYWDVNNIVFVVLSVMGTLALSILFHPAFTYIMNTVKKQTVRIK